jgi:hypothetical protein
MESLNLTSLYQEVQADLPSVQEQRFVTRAAKRAVERINGFFDGYPSYAEITLNSELGHSASSPVTGLVFNATDYTLTLPSTLKRLDALLVNGEKAINLGAALGEADDDYYYYYERLGERTLGVQAAWASADTTIAIRGLFYIGEIGTDTTTLSIPKELKDVIYSGTMMNLAILPQFANKDLFLFHRELLTAGLEKLNETMANLTPQKQSAGPRYEY